MLRAPEVDDVVAALVLVADRFAAGMLAAPEPGAAAGSLDWSVRELGVHVAVGAEAYAAMAAGRPSPLTRLADREAAGAAVMEAGASASLIECAARLRAGIEGLASVVASADGDLPFYEHTLPAPILGGMYLAEMLVHSHDLGGVELDEAAAAIAIRSVPWVLPLVARPGRPARACLALRPHGHDEIRIDVTPASVTVGGADELGPVDARLSGQSVALLLTAYQRVNPAVALLQRRVRLTGRRPWRIRAMQTRFVPA